MISLSFFKNIMTLPVLQTAHHIKMKKENVPSLNPTVNVSTCTMLTVNGKHGCPPHLHCNERAHPENGTVTTGL